jgi:hypothetical protein
MGKIYIKREILKGKREKSINQCSKKCNTSVNGEYYPHIAAGGETCNSDGAETVMVFRIKYMNPSRTAESLRRRSAERHDSSNL